MIKNALSAVEIILKVKDVLLNENEKKIVIKLILYFDNSNFFEPENKVQYSFMDKKGLLTKKHYFHDYLKKHADVISDALSESADKDLIDKLKGFKKINKETHKLIEEFEITPREIKEFKNRELPRLKKIIDYYQMVMCYAIISLIETLNIEDRRVSKVNFQRIIDNYEK